MPIAAIQLPLVPLQPIPADLSGILGSISSETLLVLALYGALAGAYLVVVPLLLYAWMHKRWMVMGKLERTGIYGLVFLFFPGLILFSPFLNLRMAGQGEARS
ncbi:MAG: NAD(P)H-quinone oxidoreductase subunit L [Synechococcus sp. ELA057]|jgi:NAD(P)H-quinone oxidoreductase subunit L